MATLKNPDCLVKTEHFTAICCSNQSFELGSPSPTQPKQNWTSWPTTPQSSIWGEKLGVSSGNHWYASFLSDDQKKKAFWWPHLLHGVNLRWWFWDLPPSTGPPHRPEGTFPHNRRPCLRNAERLGTGKFLWGCMGLSPLLLANLLLAGICGLWPGRSKCHCHVFVNNCKFM